MLALIAKWGTTQDTSPWFSRLRHDAWHEYTDRMSRAVINWMTAVARTAVHAFDTIFLPAIDTLTFVWVRLNIGRFFWLLKVGKKCESLYWVEHHCSFVNKSTHLVTLPLNWIPLSQSSYWVKTESDRTPGRWGSLSFFYYTDYPVFDLKHRLKIFST